MATILETINTVTDKIVALVGTRANKDLSNLTQLGEAKLVSGTSGLPVGSVIAYMGTDVPTGYLLMDGRTLSRTTYAALFAVIGTTQGAGDGSTTFGIADMTDGRYLMGSTVAGGSKISCGLPQIYGYCNDDISNSNAMGGAFAITYSYENAMWYGAINVRRGRNWDFYASRSSAAYGRSTQVTPESYSCKFFIKF